MVNLFRGFVFLWLSCIGIVHAADTGWLVSPQNDHARIRFQAERAKRKGLLTVELKPGWKTYWRSPGEVASPKITGQKRCGYWYWPVPSRFDISGLTTRAITTRSLSRWSSPGQMRYAEWHAHALHVQ
jgi:suppressor for copper-sensitivity B